MSRTPAGLISLMDGALCPAIAKVRVQLLVKAEFFQALFQLLRLLTQLQGSFPLS